MSRAVPAWRVWRAALLALVIALGTTLPLRAQIEIEGTPEASPGASTPAPAADAGPAFVIYPKGGTDGEYFTVEAEPGSTTELTVVLGNADDEAMDLRTYAADAVPQPNGGFGVADAAEPVTGAGTWIDYEPETFTFEPGKGVERAFTVTVPDDTAPGQYIAGLALETAEPLAVEGSEFFNQVIRKVVAVFIVVPGAETPEFSLGEPELLTGGRFPQISVPVINSGNVLVKPQGSLILTDSAGNEVLRAPIAMGSVYAGTTVPLLVSLRTPVPDGDYGIAVDLTDTATGTAASLRDGTIAITTPEESTLAMTGEVTLAPDAANPAYADVALTIENAGDAIGEAQVLLDVMKDGELVETFPLAASLALPTGTTEVAQRYIPPTGWEAGEWSFVVRLDVIDSATGSATTVATLNDIAPVTVGG